ncbi:MAG: aconitase X catalytic domain-containing protein [Pseudomonadota bacterium]
MQLDPAQQKILDGEQGQAARMAMEILVALGRIYGALRLAPVRSVQIAGVSYHNLGDAGLEYLADLAVDGKVQVPTTLNPAGMDLERWTEMGISEDFAAKQRRVIEAYTRMGVSLSCTCTPYLLGNRPRRGETLAWSESSAVTFANSVLGARTNREGGPSALASALTGVTAIYGLHLDNERRPTLAVHATCPLAGSDDWGLLGAVIGKTRPGALPWIRSRTRPDDSELRALSAALPTFGGKPMFHLQGVTPEAEQHRPPDDVLTVDRAMIERTRAELESGDDTIDLVALGCPHASFEELETIAHLLDGGRAVVPLWISTARGTLERARAAGIVQNIEALGGHVWADTCFAVAPLKGRFARVATSSAKGCFYGSGHNLFRMRLGSLEQCIAAACSGTWT